jgi:spore coat protein U-like protein
MRSIFPIALLSAGMMLAPPCVAQGLGGVIQCQLAATSMAFGRYSPSGAAPGDSTATLTVSCITASATPVPVRATVALNSVAPVRQLSAKTHTLRYQLYVDAARTVPWGDGSGGTATLPATGFVSRSSPFHQQVIVYGRVLARQKNAAVGSYTDQLSSTLNY